MCPGIQKRRLASICMPASQVRPRVEAYKNANLQAFVCQGPRCGHMLRHTKTLSCRHLYARVAGAAMCRGIQKRKSASICMPGAQTRPHAQAYKNANLQAIVCQSPRRGHESRHTKMQICRHLYARGLGAAMCRGIQKRKVASICMPEPQAPPCVQAYEIRLIVNYYASVGLPLRLGQAYKMKSLKNVDGRP